MPLIKNGAAPAFVKSEPVPGVVVGLASQNLQSDVARRVDANDAVPDFVKVTNLQPDDMRAEQRRIQRSGLFQAALQSPALMQYAPTLEDYWALVRKAADEGLKWVNELQ